MFWKPVPIAIASAFAATAPIMMPIAASPLEIGAARVQMLGEERTATLNVRNISDSPAGVRIRTVAWDQPRGGDVYAPSSELVASPARLELAPGESRTIHLTLRNAAASGDERAFRLILGEASDPALLDEGAVQASGRAQVPVFVTPSGNARPKLRWTAVRSPQGVKLTAFNDGDAHDRLLGMSIRADGQPLARTVDGYVLSGGSRSWLLPAVPAATNLRIRGEGEFGAVSAEVPVTQ